MYKVALTGNYYSGHYDVAKLFEEIDVKIFNANLITKFIINYSPSHIKKIKKTFGDDIYTMGLLDLNKFNSNSKFNDLLDLIEFDILRSYEKFKLLNKNNPYTIFVYDFIFERELETYFDYVICSDRPKDHRSLDMKFLTNFTYSQIEKILNNEMSLDKKKSKSDYIIQNFNKNGDLQSDIVIGLESEIKRIHRNLNGKSNLIEW